MIVENGGTNLAKAIDDHDIAVKIIGPVSEPLGHNHHAAVRIQSNDAKGCGCVNFSGALVIGSDSSSQPRAMSIQTLSNRGALGLDRLA